MRYGVEASLALAIVVLGTVLLVGAPAFLSPSNLIDVLLSTLPVLIAATGAMLVVTVGEIDVSVGSAFAIASVASGVFAILGVPMPAVALLTIFTGAALGALNGFLVAGLRLPSIVVTLATMVALRDGLRWMTQGAWIQDLPAGFQWFGLSQGGYPVAAIAVAGLLVLVTSLALWRLPTGRAVYATGSNANAARLAGINIALVRLVVFVVAGACTGLAALVNAVRFNQIPSNAGIGLEMQVIAAVVVGGTAITGGRGTMLGTVLGVTLLGAIGPALTFLGASPYWERALQGGIILTAVGLGAISRRSSMGRTSARPESHAAA